MKKSRKRSTLKFHGAFKSKAKAEKRERNRKGAFILKRGSRYIVATKKKG